MADQNKQSDKDSFENDLSEKKEVPDGTSTDQASGGASTDQASGGASTDQASGGASTDQASGGASTVQASGGDPTVQASGGDPTVQASGGDPTVQASGGDPTVQASGGAQTRPLSCVRFDPLSPPPHYRMHLAGPADRMGRVPEEAYVDRMRMRTVPGERVRGEINLVPMREQAEGMHHVVVRTEQAPLQETVRQDDRRMRRNDRNAIPFGRRSLLNTLFQDWKIGLGTIFLCSLAVCVVAFLIYFVYIVITYVLQGTW